MDKVILIKDVLLDNEKKYIVTTNSYISKIIPANDVIAIENNTLFFRTNRQENKSANSTISFSLLINGENKAILPAFYNLHCHAGMNILRGYSEDLPLFDWLQKIWAREALLSAQDIYNGTRLAILEMIKSGTVFFADMYWYNEEVVRAVEEMGIRCDVGVCVMDRLGNKAIDEKFDYIREFNKTNNCDRISVSPAPHAIYTCSKELYQRCYDLANECDVRMQTHVSETLQEVEECKQQHNGLSPVEYLNEINVLDNRTIAAHCVHFSEKDAEIFAKQGSIAVHNPCSNMKLSSGAFNMPLMKDKKCNITLGTDGCSSNNNLSMMEEMKFACLLSKITFQKADILTAKEVFKMATVNGAKAYNINAGEIKEGKLADFILVDLNNERLQPLYDIIHNIVYASDSSCIDTVVCNGEIVMQNHKVRNEEEIIEIAKRYAKV